MTSEDQRTDGVRSTASVVAFLVALCVAALLVWAACSAAAFSTMPEKPDRLVWAIGTGLLVMLAGGYAVAGLFYWTGRWELREDPTRVATVDQLGFTHLEGKNGRRGVCAQAVLGVAGALSFWVAFALLGTSSESLVAPVIAGLLGPSALLCLSVLVFQRPRFLLPHEYRVRLRQSMDQA